MTVRDELFQRLADELSIDIADEMDALGLSPAEVTNRVLPRGAPGAQWHRPVLLHQLELLLAEDRPLDLVTCLQVRETYGWSIGLIEDEDEDEEE